jgi:CubicO group peptidase (beta-lactamase class C family)
MRSGIRFEEEYSSPFSKMSKFYYGKNLKKYTLELKTETTAGIDYNYQSANAQLMALVLERATGKKINEYFEEKIWKPAGMESDASWSIDSRKHQTVKAFCCVTARGLDYARFGELYLHGGKNGPVQVIPEEWIKETSTIKYDSRDSEGFPYTYFWRVTEQGNLFAKGVLGQYIFVCPRKNIVVVRFGQGTGNISWARFIEQLMDQFP